ncbi:(2Fe-2S)-binding protein [Ornithinimicrobium sp. Y1694]|uniref:(2Fe-2S)-binding protein n=1 Tax=Ornithinimicrobium sp. Y1694 TaxID=3418590 RepID=UPI003CE75320
MSSNDGATTGPSSEWVTTLAGLGGFHEVAAPPPLGSDAVPWREVLADEALSSRFATVRAALATSTGLPVEEVDPKVAVSATQVGLASRLWSVTLASTVLHRWVPDLSSDNLVTSPVHRGTVALGVVDPTSGYAASHLPDALARICAWVVEDSLALLDHTCARVGRTPARVLASNTASSLVGAARVLARQRPEAGAAAWELARALLALPQIATGGGIREPNSLPAGIGGPMETRDEAFLRSGCCVFYRLPGHGLCPDCVIAERSPEQVTPGH